MLSMFECNNDLQRISESPLRKKTCRKIWEDEEENWPPFMDPGDPGAVSLDAFATAGLAISLDGFGDNSIPLVETPDANAGSPVVCTSQGPVDFSLLHEEQQQLKTPRKSISLTPAYASSSAVSPPTKHEHVIFESSHDQCSFSSSTTLTSLKTTENSHSCDSHLTSLQPIVCKALSELKSPDLSPNTPSTSSSKRKKAVCKSEPVNNLDSSDLSPTSSSNSKKAYEIDKTPLELIHTWCCNNWCMKLMGEEKIEEARILFAEGNSSENDRMILHLHGLINPDNTFSLKFKSKHLCYRGFGMVYNFRWTRLRDRMKDVKDGFLRFIPAPRSNVTDNSLTTEIIHYIERSANSYADQMPHTGKRVIPLSLSTFWQYFMQETERICTFPHFHTVYHKHKPEDVHLSHQTTQFSCNVCMVLRRKERKIPKLKKYQYELENLKAQKIIHFKTHTGQRAEFTNNMAAARTRLSKKMLMILTDGMDQRKSRLPMVSEFGLDTKEMQCLETHIFGCFAIGKSFKSYIDFKQIGHNANQNISCILYTILDVARQGNMPREKLLLQLDNTASQNKNQWLMSFLGLLVLYGIFEEVQVDFLDCGHTHNDIDRNFSYFGKKFRLCGNETIEKMRENIATSFTDFVDHLTPETELNDENWGINVWMKPHMTGLSGLADHHGFLIKKFPELKDEPVDVGLIYKQWAKDPWIRDIKPLFKSLPVGKPPMEYPSYDKIDLGEIGKTVDKMIEMECLTREHKKEWDDTFAFIKEKVKDWEERLEQFKLPIKFEKTKTVFLQAEWKESWPLEDLIKLCDEQQVVEEPVIASGEYNPEHTVLNKYEPAFPIPVTVKGEKNSRIHQTFIVPKNVEAGKFAILFCDVDYCLKHKCRPLYEPWVAKIITDLDEETELFTYCWVPYEMTKGGRIYNIWAPTPDVTEGSASQEYFGSILELFTKTTGFTKSGRLKKTISDSFKTCPKVIKADELYMKSKKEHKYAGFLLTTPTLLYSSSCTYCNCKVCYYYKNSWLFSFCCVEIDYVI